MALDDSLTDARQKLLDDIETAQAALKGLQKDRPYDITLRNAIKRVDRLHGQVESSLTDPSTFLRSAPSIESVVIHLERNFQRLGDSKWEKLGLSSGVEEYLRILEGNQARIAPPTNTSDPVGKTAVPAQRRSSITASIYAAETRHQRDHQHVEIPYSTFGSGKRIMLGFAASMILLLGASQFPSQPTPVQGSQVNGKPASANISISALEQRVEQYRTFYAAAVASAGMRQEFLNRISQDASLAGNIVFFYHDGSKVKTLEQLIAKQAKKQHVPEGINPLSNQKIPRANYPFVHLAPFYYAIIPENNFAGVVWPQAFEGSVEQLYLRLKAITQEARDYQTLTIGDQSFTGSIALANGPKDKNFVVFAHELKIKSQLLRLRAAARYLAAEFWLDLDDAQTDKVSIGDTKIIGMLAAHYDETRTWLADAYSNSETPLSYKNAIDQQFAALDPLMNVIKTQRGYRVEVGNTRIEVP